MVAVGEGEFLLGSGVMLGVGVVPLSVLLMVALGEGEFLLGNGVMLGVGVIFENFSGAVGVGVLAKGALADPLSVGEGIGVP